MIMRNLGFVSMVVFKNNFMFFIIKNKETYMTTKLVFCFIFLK